MSVYVHFYHQCNRKHIFLLHSPDLDLWYCSLFVLWCFFFRVVDDLRERMRSSETELSTLSHGNSSLSNRIAELADQVDSLVTTICTLSTLHHQLDPVHHHHVLCSLHHSSTSCTNIHTFHTLLDICDICLNFWGVSIISTTFATPGPRYSSKCCRAIRTSKATGTGSGKYKPLVFFFLQLLLACLSVGTWMWCLQRGHFWVLSEFSLSSYLMTLLHRSAGMKFPEVTLISTNFATSNTDVRNQWVI